MFSSQGSIHCHTTGQTGGDDLFTVTENKTCAVPSRRLCAIRTRPRAGSGITKSGRRFSWRVALRRLQGYGSEYTASGKRYSARLANQNGKSTDISTTANTSSTCPFLFSSILLSPQRQRRRRRPTQGRQLQSPNVTVSASHDPQDFNGDFTTTDVPGEAGPPSLPSDTTDDSVGHDGDSTESHSIGPADDFQRDQPFGGHEAILQEFDENPKQQKRQFHQWKKSLRKYTGEEYKKINGALRNGGTDEKELKNTIDHAVLAMKAGLRWDGLLKVCEKDATLYRGSGKIPGANLQAGSTYSDKAFFSTSRELNTAVNYLRAVPESERYLFRITRHSNGIDLGSKNISKNAHEAEILFSPSTMFNILEVQQNKPVEGLEGTVTIVVLQEMV